MPQSVDYSFFFPKTTAKGTEREREKEVPPSSGKEGKEGQDKREEEREALSPLQRRPTLHRFLGHTLARSRLRQQAGLTAIVSHPPLTE